MVHYNPHINGSIIPLYTQIIVGGLIQRMVNHRVADLTLNQAAKPLETNI